MVRKPFWLTMRNFGFNVEGHVQLLRSHRQQQFHTVLLEDMSKRTEREVRKAYRNYVLYSEARHFQLES